MAKPFEKGAFDYDRNVERLLPQKKPDTIESFWIHNEGKHEIPRMSKEALVRFVEEFCDGSKMFTSQDFRNEDAKRFIPIVFLPVALGAFPEWTEEELGQIGLFWEYWSAALPRSINGYPCFPSMHVMHIEDWRKVAPAVNNELLRRKERGKSIADDL